MANIIPLPQPGTSPLDAIRHTRPDASEYWTARELSPHLGYLRYGDFKPVLERTVEDIENQGNSLENHMRRAPHMVAIGSGANREVEDWHLSRLACYLACMNAQTPEGSAKRQYFAIRTRQAEIELPAAPQPLLPWAERWNASIAPHRIAIGRNHGWDFWSVYTAIQHELFMTERELAAHLLPLKKSDMPDGSIGQLWATFRLTQDWAGQRFNDCPLALPHFGRSPVRPWVYAPDEMSCFFRWLYDVYFPVAFPNYLLRKFTAPGQALPAASAADRACRLITGNAAVLDAPVRRQLTQLGKPVRIGDRQQLEGTVQGELF